MYPGRTDEVLIATIIEIDTSIVDLSPFISSANELVTEFCVPVAPAVLPAYTATRLELIERWLAAHFYATRDREPQQETAGPVGSQYFGKVDLGLKSTHYGQQAMRLDTYGGLAAWDNAADEVVKMPPAVSPNVGVTYLGTAPSVSAQRASLVEDE